MPVESANGGEVREMKITIEATPEEIAKLLQAVGSNLEQQLVKIIHDPSNTPSRFPSFYELYPQKGE